MNNKICPFMSGECQYTDCSLFVKTDSVSRCAVAVIAEELRASSAGTDLIADNLQEINSGLTAITNVVKGLV